MDEKKEERTFATFLDENKYVIISVGAVIIAYKLGRKHGYNSAISLIDHSLDKLEEVLIDASEVIKF